METADYTGRKRGRPRKVKEAEPESEPEPEVKYITRDGSTHIYSVSNVSGIQVTLEIVGEECWVQVRLGDSNGTELKQKKYRKGETDTWEIADSAFIRLGFPSAARLKVNGIPIDEAHFAGSNPVNFQFNLVTAEQEG